MKISKAIDTALSYIEKQMTPGMSDLQEVLFYTLVEAIHDEADNIVDLVAKNPFARSLLAIDKDGNVDVDKLTSRIKKGMERKGSLSFDVPMYGPVRFLPEDIDNITAMMREEISHENYQDFRRIN